MLYGLLEPRLLANVGDTHHFEDRAHRAAGDDAGTGRSRRHQHLGRAVFATDVVVDRAVLQGDLDHVAASRFHGLLHGDRHFTRLALAHADAAVAVAHDRQSSEAEDTTALHDLGDAVDRDHLFLQTVVTTFVLNARLELCHFRFLG